MEVGFLGHASVFNRSLTKKCQVIVIDEVTFFRLKAYMKI